MPRQTPRNEDFLHKDLFPPTHGQATETRVVPDPRFAPVDHSRPDLPDENDDGLDELTEEVIRMAEDIPTGAGIDPIEEEAPIDELEPVEALENQGEFPGLDDQGDTGEPPRRRSTSARRPS